MTRGSFISNDSKLFEGSIISYLKMKCNIPASNLVIEHINTFTSEHKYYQKNAYIPIIIL